MRGSVGLRGGRGAGASVPFSFEPILVKMEGGRYLNPILPVSMADLVVGRRSSDGGGPKTSSGSSKGGDCESGGGNKKPSPKVAATGGPARVRVRYNAHLPSLSLRGGENSRYILAGAVLPTLHGHVLCKNWHLCGVCWEDCKRKNSHPPNPPEVATTISGLLKVAQGEWQGCLQPSCGNPSSYPQFLGVSGLDLKR